MLELAGIALVADPVPWLRELKPSRSRYRDADACLTDSPDEQADGFKGFFRESGGRDCLGDTACHMRTWLQAIQSFG